MKKYQNLTFEEAFKALDIMIHAYVSGDAEFDMYGLLNTMKNEYNNLAAFIVTNWHHCPFSENCDIDWDECTGWGSSNCVECLAKYSDKLNTKEN